MDDASNLDDDEIDLSHVRSEMSDKLKAAIQAERERLGTVVHRADPETYRHAVEGIIALGGSDPNAWAPGRRRFR